MIQYIIVALAQYPPQRVLVTMRAGEAAAYLIGCDARQYAVYRDGLLVSFDRGLSSQEIARILSADPATSP